MEYIELGEANGTRDYNLNAAMERRRGRSFKGETFLPASPFSFFGLLSFPKFNISPMVISFPSMEGAFL